jgi:hypothetical protein
MVSQEHKLIKGILISLIEPDYNISVERSVNSEQETNTRDLYFSSEGLKSVNIIAA